MSFYLNHAMRERIQRNDTFIAPVPEGAFVFLRGTRNAVSQRTVWEIFIHRLNAPAVARLSCAACLREVFSADRICECGAHCGLALKRGDTGCELHLDVAMEPFDDVPGVSVFVRDVSSRKLPPEHAIPMNTEGVNLRLGVLSCPHSHGMGHNRVLNEQHICVAHQVKIGAVLVYKAGEAWVEQRVYPMSYGAPGDQSVQDTLIARLRCPFCHHPIREKSLVCRCHNVIIDVRLKWDQLHTAGGRKIGSVVVVERAPRWAWQIHRPPDMIPMEVFDASGEQETYSPLPQMTVAERERVSPNDVNRAALREEAVKLLKENTYSQTEEILGITRGKLQQLVKEYKALNPPTS